MGVVAISPDGHIVLECQIVNVHQVLEVVCANCGVFIELTLIPRAGCHNCRCNFDLRFADYQPQYQAFSPRLSTIPQFGSVFGRGNPIFDQAAYQLALNAMQMNQADMEALAAKLGPPDMMRKKFETKEEREQRQLVKGQTGAELTAIAALKKKGQPMVYNLRIESPFVLTQTRVKTSLGAGFKVLSIEVEKDQPQRKIETVDDAVAAIIQTGYRALARAHHPDLGGDPDIMMILNKSKKELLDLLESVKA